MDGNNKTLTPRQLRTIPYLLGASSIEEGCKRARVGKATVYGWLKQETFRNALDGRRKQAVDLAFETLKANLSTATQTLVKHLDSTKETISIRAAESIIEYAQRAIETDELENPDVRKKNQRAKMKSRLNDLKKRVERLNKRLPRPVNLDDLLTEEHKRNLAVASTKKYFDGHDY